MKPLLAIDSLVLSAEDEDLRGRVLSIMTTRSSRYLRISRLSPYGLNMLHSLIYRRIDPTYLPSKGAVVDHVDGNYLNNSRDNLRLVDRTRNSRNSRVRTTSLSGLKGVMASRTKGATRYYARLYLNTKDRVNGRMHADKYEAHLDWLCMHRELRGYDWERAEELDIGHSHGRNYHKQGQTRRLK